MSSVHAIPAGHAGSGRDGRRGNHSKVMRSGVGLFAIGTYTQCMHVDHPAYEHDCLGEENRRRNERNCPPLEIVK